MAFKELHHGPKEQDECHKKCNPDGKKFRDLDESEVKKIKDCLTANNCVKPDRKFNHRNSTEFQAFIKCRNEKCPNDPQFKPTRLGLNKTRLNLNTTRLPLNTTRLPLKLTTSIN